MELTPWGTLSPRINYLHVQPEGIETLTTCVARHVDGRGKAQKLIEFGAVYVNQIRIIESETTVESEDVVRIHLDPKRYVLNKFEVQQRVVAETDHYLIVDKPSGLPMHPTLDNLYENLMNAFSVPVFVTHRLDVPTSGLVLVAKTKEYQRAFNKLVSERKLTKAYQAWSIAEPPLGLHRHYMKTTVKAPKEVSLEPPQDCPFDECVLEIKDTLKLEICGQTVFESSVRLHTGANPPDSGSVCSSRVCAARG